MSQRITSHFWILRGGLSSEHLASACLGGGLNLPEKTSEAEFRSKMAAGTRELGTTRMLPLLRAPALPGVTWVVTYRLYDEGAALVVVSCGEHELPRPDREPCPPEHSLTEDLLSRVRSGLDADYAYTDFDGSVGVLLSPAVRRSFSDDGFRLELEALRRGRILQFYAINHLSDPLVDGLPKLRERFRELRCRRVPDFGWCIAFTRCLAWDPIAPTDELGRDVGVDACWRRTGDLDVHAPDCPERT